MARLRRFACASALAALITTVGLGVAAPPASAGLLGCGPQTIEHPFTAWDDDASYVLATGGSAESPVGWALRGGATVVGGNEPFYVHSASDSHSVAIPSGASASTPWTCIELKDPTLRFFVANLGSQQSTLRIDVQYRTILGTVSHQVTTVSADEWQPSGTYLYLANLTGILALDGVTSTVSFRFTAQGSGGNWRVDDVYVDPWVLL